MLLAYGGTGRNRTDVDRVKNPGQSHRLLRTHLWGRGDSNPRSFRTWLRAKTICPLWLLPLGREDRIRTCDFTLPKRTLYQAELLPGGAAERTRTSNNDLRRIVLFQLSYYCVCYLRIDLFVNNQANVVQYFNHHDVRRHCLWVILFDDHRTLVYAKDPFVE